jgi:uncharacterized protein with ParB-like and HNH nuclease domain
MEADVHTIDNIKTHLIDIPQFQRYYQWEKPNWQRLWFEIGSSYFDRIMSKSRTVFLGAIVRQKFHPFKRLEREVDHFGLIDGQQRLVTLSLIAAAARDLYYEPGSAKSDNWTQDFLKIRLEQTSIPRLVVQEKDRVAYETAIDEKKDKKQQLSSLFHDSLIASAYDFFYEILSKDEDSLLESLTEYESLKLDEEEPPDDQDKNYLEKKIPEHKKSNDPISKDSKSKLISKGGLKINEFYNVLYKDIKFVDIILEENEDFGSEIFESLNSTGTSLTPVDLIRNGLFLLLPQERDLVHRKYWCTLENGHIAIEVGKGKEDLLTLKKFFSDEAIRLFGWTPEDQTYSRLMTHIRFRALQKKNADTSEKQDENYRSSIFESLENLLYSDSLYRYILGSADKSAKEFEMEFDYEICNSLNFLREWDAEPVRPLILEVLIFNKIQNPSERSIKQKTILDSLHLIETFLVRRCVGGIPPQQLRSLLSNIPINIRDLSKERKDDFDFYKTLVDCFKKLDESRFPSKNWLKENWKREAYIKSNKTRKQVALVLWEIEKNQLKEQKVSLGVLKYGKGKNKFTIEHIMPQFNLLFSQAKKNSKAKKREKINDISDEWKNDLKKWGIEFPREFFIKYRHILANLTLALHGDNSSYGIAGFDRKVELYQTNSKLDITLKTVCIHDKWDENSLQTRAMWLIDEICKRWPIPWEQ